LTRGAGPVVADLPDAAARPAAESKAAEQNDTA
jgi:hypothetical protein